MSSSCDLLRGKVLRGGEWAISSSDELHPFARGVDEAAPTIPAAVLEAAEAEGRARGYLDGAEEGRRAGLAAAADDLHARQAIALGEIEGAVAAAALDLAAAIVGRELQLAEAPGRDALARAMRLVPDHTALVVRIHPTDAHTIGELDELAPGRVVTLVADPNVEQGGCVVDVGAARIDAQLSSAIERAREVLAP